MPVLIENRQSVRRLNTRRISRNLMDIMDWLDCSDRELSVVLVDNPEIQRINREYLGRDRPTNVISFAMQEGDFTDINPGLLGDIVVSVEQALADAERERLSLIDELDFLLIHGLLHLLGFEHEQVPDVQAEEMRSEERRLFERLKGYSLI